MEWAVGECVRQMSYNMSTQSRQEANKQPNTGPGGGLFNSLKEWQKGQREHRDVSRHPYGDWREDYPHGQEQTHLPVWQRRRNNNNKYVEFIENRFSVRCLNPPQFLFNCRGTYYSRHI